MIERGFTHGGRRYEAIRPGDLGDADWHAWEALVAGHADLASPFFAPAFTRAVAGVRRDARVAVLRDEGRAIGFLPYHGGRLGQPIGAHLSDFHGLIAAPGTVVDLPALLRACRLSAWRFDHLVGFPELFAPHTVHTSDSPVIDLAGGFDAYTRRVRQGSDALAKLGRAQRKLVREVGPLRFVARDESDRAFDTLFRWKTQQYRRTGVPDVLAGEWVRALLARLRGVDTPGFAGCLSTLYIGDRLIAAHLGMRTARVWHYWFPAFDREMGSYSPGNLLLMEIARHCCELGVERIDLGKGPGLYKAQFATGSLALREGTVESGDAISRLIGAAGSLRQWLKRSNAMLTAVRAGKRHARALAGTLRPRPGPGPGPQ